MKTNNNKLEELLSLLPETIRKSKEFTKCQKRILAQLIFLNGLNKVKNDGYFFRDNLTLCKECNVTIKTLLSARNLFERLKLIKTNQGKRGKSTEYILNIDNIINYTGIYENSTKTNSVKNANYTKTNNNLISTKTNNLNMENYTDILNNILLTINRLAIETEGIKKEITLINSTIINFSVKNTNYTTDTDTESDINIHSKVSTNKKVDTDYYKEENTKEEKVTANCLGDNLLTTKSEEKIELVEDAKVTTPTEEVEEQESNSSNPIEKVEKVEVRSIELYNSSSNNGEGLVTKFWNNYRILVDKLNAITDMAEFKVKADKFSIWVRNKSSVLGSNATNAVNSSMADIRKILNKIKFNDEYQSKLYSILSLKIDQSIGIEGSLQREFTPFIDWAITQSRKISICEEEIKNKLAKDHSDMLNALKIAHHTNTRQETAFPDDFQHSTKKDEQVIAKEEKVLEIASIEAAEETKKNKVIKALNSLLNYIESFTSTKNYERAIDDLNYYSRIVYRREIKKYNLQEVVNSVTIQLEAAKKKFLNDIDSASNPIKEDLKLTSKTDSTKSIQEVNVELPNLSDYSSTSEVVNATQINKRQETSFLGDFQNFNKKDKQVITEDIKRSRNGLFAA